MKIKSLSIAILVLCLISCNSGNADKCQIKELKTLFTTVGIHDKDTAYAHYVLIKGFARECMDSLSMVRLATKYRDTVETGRPVEVVMFFNSNKDFIPNETSQDMEKINKSCLVTIGFDVPKGTHNMFIFYNKKGEKIYWGERWLPNGQ